MHIVLPAIQILLFKKGYVEVQHDRAHNNNDSINQDGMFCMYRIEITSEVITVYIEPSTKKIQNKLIAVVFGLLPIHYIRLFAR